MDRPVMTSLHTIRFPPMYVFFCEILQKHIIFVERFTVNHQKKDIKLIVHRQEEKNNVLTHHQMKKY